MGAKVALIERTAWEKFDSHEPAESHEVVERALLESGAEAEIVKQVIRTVSRKYDPTWIHIVKWCIEFRARIHAHFAPTRHHVDVGGELRVAGKTPCEVDQEMLKRLMDQIHERRRHQQVLDDFRES